MRLVADKGNDHAVEVEEEHQKVETKLDEGFLLVYIELAEDLGRVKKVLVVIDLLGIESQQWQVQNDCKPVAVDHEEEGKEGVDTSFGDNVGVESVAQIDRVDIVALEITVHDSEEDLQEQVDGVDQHRQ